MNQLLGPQQVSFFWLAIKTEIVLREVLLQPYLDNLSSMKTIIKNIP